MGKDFVGVGPQHGSPGLMKRMERERFHERQKKEAPKVVCDKDGEPDKKKRNDKKLRCR